MDGQPPAAEAVGHAARPADERFGKRPGTHRHEQAMPRLPRAGVGLRLAKFPRVHAHVVGHEPQGQFAQRGEIGFAEKVLRGGGGAVGHIHPAFVQPLDEFGGREIHEFKHRVVEHAVRHRFANLRAGDLADGVGAAFDVLDVERGDDIHAGVEQFGHVLPAFRVTRAGGVRVREFIHEDKLRMPREGGVEIKFGECDAAMFELAAGNLRQAFGERVRFLASVRLNVTDDHVAPGGQFASRGIEHGVGLAHAGAHAEKNLKLAAFLRGFLALERTQQRIRIGAVAAVHEFILTNPAPDSASKRSSSQHDCGSFPMPARQFCPKFTKLSRRRHVKTL